MGLRTASVRRPDAEVMAPALTETSQTQTFKLPPDAQSASPINSLKQPRGEAVYISLEAATCRSLPSDAPQMNGGARPPPMADRDTMGLRKMNLDDVSDLLKADEEHIFDGLPSSETDDLMQVFKALDGHDAEALAQELLQDDMMSISNDEEIPDARELCITNLLEEVSSKQARLGRQLDFLLRRIRKQQTRAMSQHVSAEIAGVFENVNRTIKRQAVEDQQDNSEASLSTDPPVDHKPLNLGDARNLVKKLELSNVMYANAAFWTRMKRHAAVGAPETFRQPPGQVVPLPKWAARERIELQNVSGLLESEMRIIQEEVDSEATLSSSGADSCDDAETYNNQHQQHLAIHKRAAWKYATDRAAIGAKWTWLQSQIADLEYKIRQYSDLQRKLRNTKVKLGNVSPPHQPPEIANTCVNGYRGPLPGATAGRNGESETVSKTPSMEYQCARTRPLVAHCKRKLVQLSGLHCFSKKADRPATMRCGCLPPNVICALCTARVDPMQPRDHPEYLSKNESLALLDSSYHPVFSLYDSIPSSLHVEGIVKTHDWKQWSVRSAVKTIPKAKLNRPDSNAAMKEPSGVGRPRKPVDHRKKNNRLIKPSTVNALTAKIKSRARKKQRRSGSISNKSRKRSRKPSGQSVDSDGNDDEVDALGPGGGKIDASESPLLSSLNKRIRTDSYDIDNIVIPFSLAATARVEKIHYKEIMTPKWRLVPDDYFSNPSKHEVKNNGASDRDDIEDFSDAAVLIRHERCEQEERKRFLSYLKLPLGYGRSRANRRTDSRAESSGCNTPDPMSPAPNINIDAPLDRDPSRPATPKIEDIHPPTSSAVRRRTISSTPDLPAIPSYELRVFPLSDESYQRMLRRMQSQQITYIKQGGDLSAPSSPAVAAGPSTDLNQCAVKRELISTASANTQDPDSESTESAFGDEEPDPTDPEWDADIAPERFIR